MIIKILTDQQWAEFQANGLFRGSPADAADGFIHFSTPDQVPGTLEKHYQGVTGLVLVEVDETRLGDDLKWETSRGGERFPHLYADLSLAAVVSSQEVASQTSDRG
ncbi:MAG: DUF952 domain-containing protein [Planctomycetota bacterium]